MQEVWASNPTLGGLRINPFKSQWKDKHPAIKGFRPPEHHVGCSTRTKKTPPSQTEQAHAVVAKVQDDFHTTRSRQPHAAGSSKSGAQDLEGGVSHPRLMTHLVLDMPWYSSTLQGRGPFFRTDPLKTGYGKRVFR